VRGDNHCCVLFTQETMRTKEMAGNVIGRERVHATEYIVNDNHVQFTIDGPG
jgi:hypothetical protein